MFHQTLLWACLGMLSLQQGVLAQRSSPTDQCGVASATACNECVCCCGEGLLTYKAEGCDCKPVYDAPFIAMIVLAVTTIVVGTLNGWYFGGGTPNFSPYPRPAPAAASSSGGSTTDGSSGTTSWESSAANSAELALPTWQQQGRAACTA